MTEQQIDDCCEKLCSVFSITNKKDCKSILVSFFAPSVKEDTKIVTTTTVGCQSLLKSGARKNQPCGQTVKPGTTFCGTHTPKEASSSTSSSTSISAPKITKEPKEPKVKKEVKKGEMQVNLPIIEKIMQTRETFKVQLNKFNNFVHKETNFVFNQTTKKVIGKQQEDGTILALSVKDIELCKENHWDFEIPTKVRTDQPDVVKRKVTVTVEDDEGEEESDEEEN